MKFPDITEAFFPVKKQPIYWDDNPIPEDKSIKEIVDSSYHYLLGLMHFDKDHAAIVDMLEQDETKKAELIAKAEADEKKAESLKEKK